MIETMVTPEIATAIANMKAQRPARDLMARIAAHPTVALFRTAQTNYVNRMVNMYGPDFALEGSGHEGVNRWTPRQREHYNNMMNGAAILRSKLRAELSA